MMMDRQRNRQMNIKMNKWMNRQMNIKMNRWMKKDEQINKWIDKYKYN